MHPATSDRFRGLPPYPLAGIPETKRRLLAEGVDVIDLSAGDADLAPPPAAVEGLQRAVEDPSMSRYPFNLGLAAFREEVSGWMKKRFGVDVDPAKEILPLIGSKDGIAHLPLGFLNPGDAALIPDPGYQPYKGGVWLAGGEPILVPLRPENDFLIPLDELPPDEVARSKLLYLNYPNNPTTALAPREYLKEAVEFCHAHDLLLVYDNAYSELAFDGYKPPSILEIDGGREVSLEFHSFSKTFNMTGWRMGWAVGDADLIGILGKVKSFMDTGAFLGIQAACAAALRSSDEWVPSNIETFRRRRDAAVEGLVEAGFAARAPKATMYLWVPVPFRETSLDFCRRALEEEGVIVLPGSSMGKGGEGFFRVALTTSEERLRLAASKLARLQPSGSIPRSLGTGLGGGVSTDNMSGRTSPSELPDSPFPARVHPRTRYRGALRISLAISALVHLFAIALYPSFFSGIPEATVAFGGYIQPLSPQGTELVNLRELPAEDELETPPVPEEEPRPEVPVVPAVARPTGIPGPPTVENPVPGTPAPTAAERIRPKAGDLRFWAPVDPEVTALTREELMRLQLIAELEALNDSAAIAAELAARATDWTYTDEEGKKWGVSPGKIHLGDLTIPLPFGFGASPWQREQSEDRLWAWDAIERGAATGELLRSWKDRDQAIRERMNAERKPDTTRTGGGGSAPQR